MRSELIKLIEALQTFDLTWAIGGSLMLQLRGVEVLPNDIDIIVTEEDAPKLIDQLDHMGTRLKLPPKNAVLTSTFFEKYDMNGIGVDVMAAFGSQHENGTYVYPLSLDSISDYTLSSGQTCPLSALEDWYVLYLLMPNRENKVRVIEEHFLKNGLSKKHLLERALLQPLPEHVKLKIVKMLQQYS